ncbi:MAG TPA: hypothetical protein VKS79_09235 [Gemmataceae bacterium]|nr:hypothetical protein [Gemmataceae bacterium]
MKQHIVTMPEIGLIAGTRVLLGVGIGFLLAERLDHEQRRAAGWALVLAGALTTIPLAAEVLGSGQRPQSSALSQLASCCG